MQVLPEGVARGTPMQVLAPTPAAVAVAVAAQPVAVGGRDTEELI